MYVSFFIILVEWIQGLSERCHAVATSKASDALGDAMMVAGIVGIPVFFVLLITIGPSQDSFSDVTSMLEQVASYQFAGAPARELIPALNTGPKVSLPDSL